MKLLVASAIDGDALETLRRTHDVVTALNAREDELKEAIADREVLIFRSGVTISAQVMGAAPELRLLVRAGSGLDNLDLEHVRDRGLILERIPGPGAQAVAELTFGLMLALARNILPADHSMREGRWTKAELGGSLLTEKTLGVVGLGNIGTRVAHLGMAWGMNAIGCVESPTAQRVAEYGEMDILLADCDDVLECADFVSIHVPLSDRTWHMIDARALARMKPLAFLLNMARGGIVDEPALYRELTTPGRLRGAALDVHEQEGEGKRSPLADLPQVVLTPHLGAATVDSQRQIGREMIRIVEAYAAEWGAGERTLYAAEGAPL